MGVIKKLKRAFSFKKDKKNGASKDAAKNGASNTLPAANGSLGRGSSDVDVVKTDTLQKEHKKRSWSLRSIARKPSFGKKDKDKKKDKDVSGQSSHDTTLEPALLSGVIAPAAATTIEQQTTPTPLEPSQAATTTATMESSDTSAPPLPDTEPPTAETATEAEGATEEENSTVPVLEDGETKPDDDFEVVTPEIVKDLEEYEARLAAEGRTVRVNETDDSDVAQKDEAETEQPAKADPEPHTISDVINLLSEKSDPSPVDVTDCKSTTTDNAEPKCPVQPTAAVDEPIIPAANGTKHTTAVPTPKTNGSANGHVLTNSNGGATCPALAVKPTSAQVYKPTATGPLTKQRPSSSLSRWRGWLAALVVIVALAALAVFGVSEPTGRSAIRTD